MTTEKGKIIRRQRLENGIEVILYDHSRNMTPDRWLVDLLCEASIPIDDSFWETAAREDPEHLPGIRKMLGESLVFASNRKRSFLDTGERDSVLGEMVQQVYSSMLEYLKRPDFPQRLFIKKYNDARQKLLLQQAMDRIAED